MMLNGKIYTMHINYICGLYRFPSLHVKFLLQETEKNQATAQHCSALEAQASLSSHKMDSQCSKAFYLSLYTS